MKLLASVFCIVLSGCVILEAPPDDLGFSDAESLDAFSGCYQNCSSEAHAGSSVCLSSVIWPDRFETSNRPDAVLVTANGKTRLVVSGLRDGEKIVESEFEDGEHFKLSGGQLHLKREYFASGATEPGNVFIGVGTAKTVLGIDPHGEGRVLESGTFLGTGFLIFPIAAHSRGVGKIQRIEGGC